MVNESVKNVLNETIKSGKYKRYSSSDRAKIGKYAAKNGVSKATRPKVKGLVINESTVRTMKSKCFEKLKASWDECY